MKPGWGAMRGGGLWGKGGAYCCMYMLGYPWLRVGGMFPTLGGIGGYGVVGVNGEAAANGDVGG